MLREAFDYSYAQIGNILQSSEPAVRQLVSRARKRVAGDRRTPVTASAQRELLTTFIAAARSGDTTALERLFAAGVTSLSDGNGMRGASRIPVVGAPTVAKYYRAFANRFWAGVDVAWASVNGQAAALLSRDGVVFAVCTVSATTEGIDRVLWLFNPEKIAAVSDVSESPTS